MAFEERDLEEIRARIKLSDVVGRRMALRKQGAELVAVDNPSFTVNDNKSIWKDFGHGGEKAGDVFDFLVKHEGYTFVAAVRELADIAGVDVDRGGGGAQRHDGRGQNGGGDHADRRAADPGPAGGGARQPAGKNEVVKTWDYVDAQGALTYQTVRSQKRLPDGSWQTTKEGKPWKTYMQRRPSPDGDGSWIWALDLNDKDEAPQEFMRYKDGWIRFDEKRFVEWKLGERRRFAEAPAVRPWLYNANAVSEELAQPRGDQRTVFLPEGEPKVDVLTEWGLLAVSASGGAGSFTAECAEFFRDAADVVVLVDDDKAGRERLARVAPMLLAVGAGVRSLNFRDVWPQCPPKGDVKDWRDAGGGTRDGLLEIVEGLKAWSPEPYKSMFGAKTSSDLTAPARPYPWRIKGIAPLNDVFLIIGPSQSGKTFEVLDMAMHICTSKATFAGRKVEPGGVVYLAYEGTSGFENRVRAYMKHHGLTEADLHSFAWLTRPPNLFTEEANVDLLAREIKAVSERFLLPLGVVVIDTHNASTRGASEIKSDEIGRIMNSHGRIAEVTGVKPWLIGHTNSEGKHRGNEQLYNTIETTMLIERLHENDDAKKPEKRDEDGRVIRRARMKKQRDGSDEVKWDFVLKQVEIGRDEDGDSITSMVSESPTLHSQASEASDRRDKRDGFNLTKNHAILFKCLLRAIDEVGVPPPAKLGLPASVGKVVNWIEFGIELKKVVPQEEGEKHDTYRSRMKAQTKRFRDDLFPANVIGIAAVELPKDGDSDVEKPKMIHYVWPTGKRVQGPGISWPSAARKRRDEPKPLIDQATGQEMTGIDEPPKDVF